MQILAFLMSINVVVEIDPNYKTNIDSRYERQINYLSELSLGEFSGIENHKKLVNTKFLILGVGGVGGDIALLLAMAGVKEITVLDHDNVTDS
ncbi:ThiF family adenylyltransferase, partial [Blautia sp.]|uniref:ThiF family adenylyltransferase n=1 Tax=Blautia sp. TaxID=1955243 RepID=UPI002589506B